MVHGPITKYVYVNNGVETDVTGDVSSWQDLLVQMSREEVTGVFVDVTAPILLRRRALELAKAQFEAEGLYAKATINIYKRADYSNDYTLKKSLSLDFSTYGHNIVADFVEIEGMQSELNEYVNAGSNTKFDIPVADLQPKKWNYQRMNLLNTGNYEPPTGSDYAIFFNSGGPTIQTYYIYMSSAEMTPGSAEHIIQTQESGSDLNNNFLFKAASDVTITLHIDSEVVARGRVVTAVLLKNGIETEYSWSIAGGVERIQESIGITLNTGDTLSFGAKITQFEVVPGGLRTYFSESIRFQIEYNTVGSALVGENAVDIIDPQILLQKFLDLITEQAGMFSCEINWMPKDYQTIICAAESIRGFENAYLHGSLGDFMDWMIVQGYEHEFEDGKMTYRPRDDFFRRDLTAMALGVREMDGLVIKADQRNAYTGIKIGFEKQDYESTNGRFEANGTYDYSTGYHAGKENLMELISPYRGDSIGIELLCWERSNHTTDTKSDNDIFMVAVVPDGDSFTEYKGIVLKDVASGVVMFNAPFNPYFLTLDNESLIGVNSTMASFAGTDTNKDAVIEGYDIYGNIPITKKLFDPIVYNFEAGTHQDLPDWSIRNGLVYFTDRGIIYKGYIEEVQKGYTLEQSTEWTLKAVL